jgi:hypothetical protein
MKVLFLLSFFLIHTASSLSCLSKANVDIDWFYILKYPKKVQEATYEDIKHAYYDSKLSESGSLY